MCARALNYLIEPPFVAVDNIRGGRDRRRQTDKEEGNARGGGGCGEEVADGEVDTSAQRQWIH